ncbi:MAG: radical SAM family heme chaperone HemW [Bacteroidia bacterium]|nr:radical SAM family heme chaperone HemW [Bacteroidia bacterium]
MSSLYIHIPFCHYKCSYCDFHFSVNKKSKDKVIDAIIKEIIERQDYLQSKELDTIYFGGGTPSVLSIEEWVKIFHHLSNIYTWNKNTEITVECNPEDVNIGYLLVLKNLGVNRISLGVQSLNDKVLAWMGRKHKVAHALKSIKDIQQAGIENFSIDLIFGIPFYDMKNLEKDIYFLLNQFNIPHISAYQLTVEPKTKLNYLVRKKKISFANEDKVRNEFLMLHDTLNNKGYLHYEVSNYAKEGYIAKHNSAYWLQKTYCGIGPSAHSYNGIERRWNVSNNYVYANSISEGKIYYEKEILNANQKFNEYVFTRLRTTFGCNLNEIKVNFGEKYAKHFLDAYSKNKAYFEVDEKNQKYYLSPSNGYLMADKISLNFFVV